MSVITIKETEEFKKLLTANQKSLVILFFSAEWSDESKLMSDVVTELMKVEKISKCTKFVKIEAEDFEDISMNYDIEAVPTFVFLRNGEITQRVVGANAPELRKQINQLVQVAHTFEITPKKSEDLNSRLEGLINTGAITLFMKGSPQEPRCGFSRQMIGILKSQDCQFSYFDILSDNEVREGLKVYSDWPTFPQLYIKGELVGGLDILKELVESGEFKSMIPVDKKETLHDRLSALVKRSKVMLFMKGDRSQPQCGFSRQMIGIMNEAGADYSTFDILTDEEVRAGLKEFSNWPTFPQLYVDGELVGGLDIVKELVQEGEFEAALKGQ